MTWSPLFVAMALEPTPSEQAPARYLREFAL
jgi:hypothetical protein